MLHQLPEQQLKEWLADRCQEFTAVIYGQDKTFLRAEAIFWAEYVVREYGESLIRLAELPLFFQQLIGTKVYGRPSANTMAVEFKEWYEKRSLELAMHLEIKNKQVKEANSGAEGAIPCPPELSRLNVDEYPKKERKPFKNEINDFAEKKKQLGNHVKMIERMKDYEKKLQEEAQTLDHQKIKK